MSATEFIELNRDKTPLTDAQVEAVKHATLVCVAAFSGHDGEVVASVLQSVLVTILYGFNNPMLVWQAIQKEVSAAVAQIDHSDCAGEA